MHLFIYINTHSYTHTLTHTHTHTHTLTHTHTQWYYGRQGIKSEKFAPVVGNFPQLLKYKARDQQMLYQYDLMNKVCVCVCVCVSA
jgi:hypothetical protein